MRVDNFPFGPAVKADIETRIGGQVSTKNLQCEFIQCTRTTASDANLD